VAVKVVSGKDHECPVLYELVKQFVEVVGKGVIKGSSWIVVFWMAKPSPFARRNTVSIS
jgi:hypothetical protein